MTALPSTANDDHVTDDELATAILEELQGGHKFRDHEGKWVRPFIPLNDPRHREACTIPLEAYVRDEIHRSFARGRMLKDWSGPTATDLRQYLKAKRKLLLTDEDRAAHDRLRVEPPPKYDTEKWWCASEAVDLIEHFSKTLPSDTGRSDNERGAFQTIAALLYEAVCNKRDANLQRACAAVLRERRAVLRGVPRDPITGAPLPQRGAW
jgi:hypothetical protein